MLRPAWQNLRTAFLAVALLLSMATPSSADTGMALSLGPLLKPICDRHIRSYESETAAAYEAWRRQNRVRLEELEQTGAFGTPQAQALKALDAPTPDQRRELERLCSDLADAFQAAAPADPRFASPERTWALFHAALRNADRETAATCLIGRAKRKLASAFAAMPDPELRQLGETIEGFTLIAGSGEYREGTVTVHGGAGSPVIFVQNGANWKISDM